jgi:purine-binding chemotaxis protein CheW
MDMPDNNIPPTTASIEFAEEVIEEIWKHRAEHLAQAVEQKNEDERIQLLLFRLGRELYGLEIKYVLDIRLIDQVTLIPRVPDWVVGVVTNRGRILTVIDLRRFFNLPGESSPENKLPTGSHPDRFQVCVETPLMEIALLVDDVLSVESIPLNQIRSQPDVWGEMRPEYVHGITHFSGSKTGQADPIIIVLNLPALLADKNLVIEEKLL